MLVIQKDVEMIEVCNQLKNILPILERVFYENGNHCVVCGTKRGRDPFRDSHEKGTAIDIVSPINRQANTYYQTKDAIGLNYRILQLPTHWHILFDPVAEISREHGLNRHQRRTGRASSLTSMPFLKGLEHQEKGEC